MSPRVDLTRLRSKHLTVDRVSKKRRHTLDIIPGEPVPYARGLNDDLGLATGRSDKEKRRRQSQGFEYFARNNPLILCSHVLKDRRDDDAYSRPLDRRQGLCARHPTMDEETVSDAKTLGLMTNMLGVFPIIVKVPRATLSITRLYEVLECGHDGRDHSFRGIKVPSIDDREMSKALRAHHPQFLWVIAVGNNVEFWSKAITMIQSQAPGMRNNGDRCATREQPSLLTNGGRPWRSNGMGI